MEPNTQGASAPKSATDAFLNEEITSSDLTTVAPLPPKIETKNLGKGRKRTFVRPAGLDLSNRMLPPITRKMVANYESLQDEKFDGRIQEADKAILPPPIDLPPTYPLFDLGEEDFSIANKMMKNIVRSEVRQVRQADGQLKPQLEEVLEYVEFINGQKQVNIATQYMLYAFLELHPLNASNKYRDKNKKPWFKRTDFEYKSVHVQMLQMDLQDDAVKYVMKLNDKELINLAAAMSNPTIPIMNIPVNQIRYDMRLRARGNPEEVLYKSPDKKASAMIDVIHALECGVIDFVPERSAYFFGEDNKTPFFEVMADANPLADLAKHISSAEGKEDYDALMEFVNFWKG